MRASRGFVHSLKKTYDNVSQVDNCVAPHRPAPPFSHRHSQPLTPHVLFSLNQSMR